jgi:lycopene cyclase domain-containing protein
VTYAQFLLIFLLLPIAVLVFTLRAHIRRAHRLACGLVCLLAFLYTTPWDNYAAYKRLWTFDPAFVLGRPFWLGYLPLEEYLFYFAEAVFVCLVLLALSRVPGLAPAGEEAP